MNSQIRESACDLAWDLRSQGRGDWESFYVSFASEILKRFGGTNCVTEVDATTTAAEVMR